MITPQTLKGFRDFLPKDAVRRNGMIVKIKNVFERYGFDPLETPALEYLETLQGKYGQEGDKLMYSFVDHGQRSVGMRYDQTVPTARVVAQYGPFGSQELSLPFKRYQIQPVWRAENTQKGRYREFLQCDADCIGSTSLLTDAEMIAVASDAIKSLGFSGIKISLNDRKVFADIPKGAITIIDKLKKIGADGVKEELQKNGFDPAIISSLLAIAQPEEIKTLISYLELFGIPKSQIQFDPTLARGLDYYTGMIFEIEINGYTAGSVAGGGRYDKLIGMFGKTDIPATGFALGFDRLVDALSGLNLSGDRLTTTEVLMSIFSEQFTREAIDMTRELREANIHVDLYSGDGGKLEKQFKYADSKHIPYVLVIGPDEIKDGKVTVKNLLSKTQTTKDRSTIVEFLKAALGLQS